LLFKSFFVAAYATMLKKQDQGCESAKNNRPIHGLRMGRSDFAQDKLSICPAVCEGEL